MSVGRPRGLLLAVLVSAVVIATREVEFFAVAYDRFHLPAFDGHVYVAMAARPGFFTVAPWGYRVLNPWLVRLVTFPLRDHVPAFFWSTALGLGASGVLLFAYLRRLGLPALSALLGVTLYGVSGPVGEVVRYQFLAEPLTFLLEMALLLSLEASAPLPVVALIAVLGVLAKEFFLLLLPLVFVLRRQRVGSLRALQDAALVALPAVVAALALRRLWTPHIHPPLPALSWQTLAVAAARFRESWPEWRGAALLMGLTPLALVGAFREQGRRLAVRGAYLFAATLASPFVNPVTFLSVDIDRLLLYALPAVIPLGFAAVGGIVARDGSSRPWGPHRLLSRLALALTVGAALIPLGIVDPYRRIDLQGSRDATVMLAVFRETLETADKIDDGEAFEFDPTSGRYAQGLTTPFNLSQLRRVRWFLRDGWGPLAARRAGDVVMASREATLLLPCLRPRELSAALTLDAPRETRLSVRVNDRPVADLLVGPDAREWAVGIPAAVLFRGDNVLTLRAAESETPLVRLCRFTIRGT
ncbi:MAG: hypothetical protein ACHQNV_01555 [Vicinamibacteria bacterium]